MHVILVETSSVRGFDCVQEMVEAGVEVTFLSGDLSGYRAKPGAELMSAATRTIEIPGLSSVTDLADQLEGRLGDNPVTGVICREEAHAYVSACLARDLGLPHEDPETTLMLTNKAAVRDELDMAGLGGLAWRAVTGEEAGLAAAREIGYPGVVKPADGGWSIGVSVVWDEASARRALREAMQPIPFAPPKPPLILVEEYAVGRHVSAEMLVQDDRVIMLGFVDRVPAPAGTTAELGGHFPARFPGMEDARQYAVDVVRALGIRCSAVHVEMLITPAGPALIEVNPRVAGHVVAHQISLALGRSLALDLVNLASGRPVAEAGVPVATVALRQLFSVTGGTVSACAAPGNLGPEVAMADVWAGPGDRVRPLRDNQDRFGYVLARGDCAEAADRAARTTADALLAELAIVPEEPADGEAAVTAVRPGRHLVLLAGPREPGDVPFDRIIDAVRPVTERISVLWIAPDEVADARHVPSPRSAGAWHHVASWEEAEKLYERLRSVGPVEGTLAASPRLEPLARRLRGEKPLDLASPPDEQSAAHIVLVLGPGPGRTDDAVPLGVIDVHRHGGGTERRFPTDMEPGLAERLQARAADAVRESGATGLVRCVLPDTDARDDAEIGLVAGVDASTVDLFDAVHTRGLLTLATEAALGGSPRPPARRARTALRRSLPAPTGPFRVVESTSADELFALTGVFRAETPLATGDIRHRGGPGTRLRFTVTGPDPARAAERAADVEASHTFRTEPLDRTHVLVLDRIGPQAWTDEDGTSLFPPDRFRLSVLSSAQDALTAGGTGFAAAVDVFDDSAVARLAGAVHATHPVHRVATVSERLLAPAALLRGRFSAPGDTARQVARFLDKAVMKQTARRAGIPHARGRVLDTRTDLTAMLERHGQVVVKPRSGSGSQGVRFLTGAEDAAHWLDTGFRPGVFLCEEYVPYQLCHVDALVTGGEPVWDVSLYTRDTLALRRGLPLSSRTVSEPGLRSAAGVLLASVIDAWQVQDGVVHLEAFRSPADELTFCEVAARPGGGGVADAFRATRGIHLDRAKLLLDAGEDPSRIRRDPVAAYAGWTVHYSPGGVLRELDDSAVADHAYARFVAAEPGQPTSASSFSGSGVSTHVFADDDPLEVRRLVELAETSTRVLLDTPPTTESAGTR
ncbi:MULTISPECIES: ATP-grasp domain-containing protein [unclassified Streptomyces]|uniref:ATP-grasp domain-containing protein n=1 Tax=unclassified Streptomyces TaxID=2593676 RepID=UPI0030776890